MKKVLLYENLTGNKLMDLLSFVDSKSDRMSITRFHYNGMLTIEEYNQMQMEFRSLLIEDIKQLRLNYIENKDGYRDRLRENYSLNTEEEEEDFFNDMLEDFCNTCKYEDFIDDKHERYSEETTDFLYVKVTRCTPVTIGPVCELCFFTLGETYKKIISNIQKLFEMPYYIKNNKFEDLALYNGERKVLAICSHEGFALMDLDDDEYEEFSKLDISHDIRN